MTPSSADEMRALAERVERARGFDNALDLQCEIALFEPCPPEQAIRLNNAGTKIIVTFDDGTERTYAARDFTISPAAREWSAAALRARAATQQGESA